VTTAEASKLQPGLYRLYWANSDRVSTAAVGLLSDGTRWFAPTDRVASVEARAASSDWGKISYVIELSYD